MSTDEHKGKWLRPLWSRRGLLGAVLMGVVTLEGAYGCIGEVDVEEFIDENVGETSSYLDAPPAAPTGLTLDGARTSAVYLKWTDNSNDESNFVVERCRLIGCSYNGCTCGPWTQPQNPTYATNMDTGQPLWPHEPNPTASNSKKWTDRIPALGVTYQYRVRASNAWGSSGWSNTLIVTMPQRRLVTQLTASELTTLANHLGGFLNDAVIDTHHHFRHVFSHPNDSQGFLYDHRRYVQQFEEYLRAQGATNLLPLPMWDSATTIPTALRPVEPMDNGSQRTPISNPSPNWPRPSQFSPPSVCNYASVGALATAIDDWHGDVHCAVGGIMCNVMLASAAYVFLSWHAYVDDAWVGWQRSCQTN